MDINDAYAWVWHIGMPHLAALSFWLMTDQVTDEIHDLAIQFAKTWM